jgi:two-component system, NtrC family, sensor kinase
MKISSLYLIRFFLAMLPFVSSAQHNPFWDVPTSIKVDSLKKVLADTNNDTLIMYLNRQIGMHYQELNRHVALAYFKDMLKLARKTNQQIWEAEAHSRMGYVSCLMQDYAGGLKSLFLAKSIASEPRAEKEMWNAYLLSKEGDPFMVRLTVLADINQHFGIVYYFTGDYLKTLEYSQKIKKLNEILNDDALRTTYHLNRAEALFELDQLDSAVLELNQSLFYSEKSGFKKYKGLVLYDIGRIYEKQKNFGEAKKYYLLSIETNILEESPDFEGMGYQALSNLSQQTGNLDSVFFYSRKALNTYLTINDTIGLIAANATLYSAFDNLNISDSAFHYLKKSISLKDGLNKAERIKSFQLTGLGEQFKLQELEAEQLLLKTNIRTYSLATGMVLLLFISGVFYRNFRRQKKDRHTIEKAFTDLKSAQAQLIQSEKMASLGELTAGIAHEIQNPLNFVNNFSEVNVELLEEVKESRARSQETRPKTEADENEDEILEYIKKNLEKITHYGKRADSIVKGMLEHSRSSTGEKVLTDINALADEYLRLAYHGIRAKDKSFSAEFETCFDPDLPKVSIVPQDIGRVLLNLINNSFFAVNERKKKGEGEYSPMVTVSTKKIENKVLISVSDNGTGIPESIRDKIFQPFYTTKPTGQGTGLGLSLSYDIIKAYGGELEVHSTFDTGAVFTIKLMI